MDRLDHPDAGAAGAPRTPPVAAALHRAWPWFVAALLWTGLVGWLALRDHAAIEELTLDLARGQGEATYRKDLLYRRWASERGGVYVPVTDTLRPSPHLAHIPERDVTTPSGRALTLVNPSWMTREVYALDLATQGVRGHITSLKPLRSDNAPDAWERDALRGFEAGLTRAEQLAAGASGRSLRLMFPFYTEAGCLRCHGAQGYRVGDVRGGVSVEVPLATYDEAAAERQATSVALFAAIWALGLAALAVGGTAVGRRFRALEAARLELVASERRFRSLFESAVDGVAVADADTGTILACNAAFAAIVDRPVDALLGLPQRALHEPDEVAGGVSRTFRTHAMAPEGRLLETVVVRPSGERRDVEITARRLVIDDRPLVQAFFRDVTERRRTEQALRAHEARLRAIFAAAHDVAFVVASTGPEAEIVEFSPGAERLFALGRDEARGLPTRELFAGASDGWRREVIERVRRGGAGASAEVELVRATGEVFWALVSLQPLHDEAGEGDGELLVALDLSQAKRLEAQVREKQKMEAIGTLAGGIAHDFNNLLTVVLGYVEIELAKPAPDAETQPNLREVLVASARARDLVSQILTFSRRTEERRVPVLVTETVHDALQLLRATLPSTLELREDLAPDVGLVLGDATRLQQVVINLLTNAHHALAGADGIVAVAVERADVTADLAAAVPGLRPGPYAVLSVTDTGAGIPAEHLPRIFEPFFTTKAPGEGTGLGLAVVHGIVASLGGVISVESAPGAGTTFRVHLPLAPSDLTSPPPSADASPVWLPAAPSGASPHVLFVDDEPALARLGERLLASLGYRATACHSATAALALFRADPAAFDVVVTDQTMPELSGEALARALLAERPDLPVLLCTGHSDGLDAAAARAAGAQALLIKPYHRRTLAAALATACAPWTPPARTTSPRAQAVSAKDGA